MLHANAAFYFFKKNFESSFFNFNLLCWVCESIKNKSLFSVFSNVLIFNVYFLQNFKRLRLHQTVFLLQKLFFLYFFRKLNYFFIKNGPLQMRSYNILRKAVQYKAHSGRSREAVRLRSKDFGVIFNFAKINSRPAHVRSDHEASHDEYVQCGM